LPHTGRRILNIAVHLEQRLDPQITRPHTGESPEVTLDRTKELLARSRATLNVANRQLGHQENLDGLLMSGADEPPMETSHR
jgi:hypothetical protein